MEIVDDHVHLFLEFRPSYSLSRVVQFLKGGSSYRMFKLHPELKKRYWGGSLWSSGKFFRSVGNVTADTIQHYIKESQGKPKAESKVCRSRESGQRRLDDFWSPANRACARPEAYPIPLSDRIHNCTQCGLSLDRDWNAAINILRLGLQSVGIKTVEACPF